MSVRDIQQVKSDDLLQLQQLAARYWARADGDTGIALAGLFTQTAVLTLGSLRLTGLPAIEDFFDKRDREQEASQRITRHVACNFMASSQGGDTIRVRSTVIVYAGNGTLPLPVAAPTGIADFEDTCIRSSSGEWMFESRTGRTVFIGEDAPSFAK